MTPVQFWPLGAALVAATAVSITSGCGSTRFAEESAAKEQIKEARKAGADADEFPALRLAKESVEFAEKAEERAERDLRTAKQAREAADEMANETRRRLEQKKGEVVLIDGALVAAEAALMEATGRETDLRKKGLTTDELSAASGSEVALRRLRLEAYQISRSTLEKQIDLAEIELEDAAIHRKAADARIESAQQRLRVARALYLQAEQQAKIAEAEALASKRAAAQAKLRSM